MGCSRRIANARGVFHHDAGAAGGELGQGQLRSVRESVRNSWRHVQRKAHWRSNAQGIPPDGTRSILEPSAALDLVGFLFYDFAATAVADKRSCLNERMGKQVFGKNITVVDDAYHPLQLGAPYDGEGIPRQKVLLVDRGVPKNLVYSRRAAKDARKSATGHGFMLPTNTARRR